MSFPQQPIFGDYTSVVGPWHKPNMQFFGRSQLASVTWSSNNRAIYYPVRLAAPTLLQIAFWSNAAAVSGNVDLGFYDAFGTRLVSTGSTAQTPTNTLQSVDIADTLVGPGLFYVALAMSSTVGTLYMYNIGTAPPFAKFLGMHTQDTAFPLPATATFATATSGHIALCGFAARPVV